MKIIAQKTNQRMKIQITKLSRCFISQKFRQRRIDFDTKDSSGSEETHEAPEFILKDNKIIQVGMLCPG
jgi:hypothetical protein